MSSAFARIQRAKLAAQLPEALAQARTRLENGATGRTILTGQIVSLNAASHADGSWVVGYVESDDGSTRIPFVGQDLPGCEVGAVVRLVGQWEEHPEFGLQFRAAEVESRLPTVRSALVRYMHANLRGCGPARAEKLIDHFGLSVLEVLARDPQRVAEVFPGKLGDQLATAFATWADEYEANRRALKLSVELMGAGMTYKLARRVERFFRKQGEAEDVVLHHPYRLIEVPGIGFKRADAIAQAMGVSATDPSRIAAGVVFALEGAMDMGHSALPRPALEKRACEELGVTTTELVVGAVERALAAGTLVQDDDLIFLPAVLETERYIAERLAEFRRASRPLTNQQRATCDAVLATLRAEGRISPRQEEAVWMMLEHRVAVLTGRPGSGKTTTTRAFVACAQALNWTLQIAAPTGKAASRAAEVTGLDAKTVHRLLGGTPGSVRDEPLGSRVIVLDEASMADLSLVAWLLRNVDPARSSLIFVGDNDQLPSVGHGRVLGDLIESGRIPTVTLTEIFRQGRGSRIIANAHRLLDGRPLLLDNAPGTDFLFADITEDEVLGEDGFPVQDDPGRPRREQEKGQRRLVRALRFLVRQKGAVPVRDIQVLTPMRKGLLGVDALNVLLQDALNPDGALGPSIGGGARVRRGDRVIQVKNDYSIAGGLFNGEQGEVLAVDASKEQITVRFDDRTLTLRGVQLANLRLAWAITVHRSQGSEFPYVILLYHTSHHVMLDVSLLYTAITRAKSLFILIGNYAAVQGTLRRGRRQGVRHTGLVRRLRAVCPPLPVPAISLQPAREDAVGA